MPPEIEIRIALAGDEAALRQLIPRSARALSADFYSDAQIEGAIRYVFGVDSTLIRDGTFFLAEMGTAMAGCGGWSRRRVLFGGDQHKRAEDLLLDPATDAARIRAFFVAPEFARQGVASQLMQACARAAWAAGFRRMELMATLPGVPLYKAFGFTPREEVTERLPDGVAILFVRMDRTMVGPEMD